jgi:hypothetical protein
MDLISLLVFIIVFCVIVWLIKTYLPIPEPIKTVIIVLIVLVAVIWLLNGLGIIGGHQYYLNFRR